MRRSYETAPRRVALAIVLAACGPRSDGGVEGGAALVAPSASSSASAAVVVASAPGALARLREAEQRREVALVSDEDLRSRDVGVRRAAARALARIGGDLARSGLLRAIVDEDEVVLSWASYGLGANCEGDREGTVSALVARAARFDPRTAPWATFARAVGRCAATTSEPTLVAWLDGDPNRASHAALGLADLAAERKKLREETIVALLARAHGTIEAGALAEALVAVARLDHLPPSVIERAAEVATKRLDAPGPYRASAIRALGRAKEQGLVGLERVLTSAERTGFSLVERVEAMRAAARAGLDGRALLERALGVLPSSTQTLADDPDGAAIALAGLDAIDDGRGLERPLRVLATMDDPDPSLDPRKIRRLARVRCAAASKLAKRADDSLLERCDPTGGPIGRLAALGAMRKRRLGAAEQALVASWLDDPSMNVRELALEIAAESPDASLLAEKVVSALRADGIGVATTAAEQLAKHPALVAPVASVRTIDDEMEERRRKKKRGSAASEKSSPPPVDLRAQAIEGLTALAARAEREHDPEALGAVLDAIGAIGATELVALEERHCASSWPSLRSHAKNALALLGKPAPCAAPPRAEELAPDVLRPAPTAPVRIELTTDAGPLALVLDPELAPVTTLRIVDLVERGFYDSNVVHRVDPAFVVQFGSPAADGYGGFIERDPLRCETSPQPFEVGSVGLALSGRDTGSSQLFVTYARAPHLDGRYPIVGRAEGPWDTLAIGDRIQKARVVR